MPLPRPLVALALLAATGGVAAAQPKAVALEVDGSCPDRSNMERALAAEGLQVQPSAPFALRIRATDGGAAMSLAGADGALLAQRATASADCDAMADAFAAIASMRLAQLPPPEPPEPAKPRLLAPPAATLAETTPEKPPAPPAAYRLSTSISGALDSGVGPSAATGLGLAVALAGHRSERGIRLSIAHAGGFDTGTPIQWSAWSARVELFTQLRHRTAWLRPGAGAALVATTVHGDGLATMPTVVRTQPAVAGSLVGGLDVTRRLALRLELAGNIYPVADRYLYEGTVVARSARASLSAALGIQINTDW